MKYKNTCDFISVVSRRISSLDLIYRDAGSRSSLYIIRQDTLCDFLPGYGKFCNSTRSCLSGGGLVRNSLTQPLLAECQPRSQDDDHRRVQLVEFLEMSHFSGG